MNVRFLRICCWVLLRLWRHLFQMYWSIYHTLEMMWEYAREMLTCTSYTRTTLVTTWILIFDRGHFLCWFEDETYITVTSSAQSSRPYVPTKCDISIDHDDTSHLIVVLTRPLQWRNYLELHGEPQVWSCCFSISWKIFRLILLFVVTAQSSDTSLLFTCSYS